MLARFFCSISLPSLFGPYFFGGIVPDKIRRVNNKVCFLDTIAAIEDPKTVKSPEFRKKKKTQFATIEGTMNKGAVTLASGLAWGHIYVHAFS